MKKELCRLRYISKRLMMTKIRKAPEVKDRATSRNDSEKERVINPGIPVENGKGLVAVMTTTNTTDEVAIPAAGVILKKEKTGIMITMKRNRSILLPERRLMILTGSNFGSLF